MERHMWKAMLGILFHPMLAQHASRQLFNHENHTLIFAGINTRLQHLNII